MTKFLGRSHFEVDRQKQKLEEIGIWLIESDHTIFKENEFSTILIFNYLFEPLKNPVRTLLLGFEELDEFLGYDSGELYQFFAFRFRRNKGRLRKPIKCKNII
ncbi:hypothetical protein [Dyadobacter tibetensis]|uniref:hypothetical protein n=1 Tax=Dyadobacter tibetensis TaxID=1211851 RepID=UPI0004708875|nr:hypothetical protein [Dyadobacter tibetensis]